MRKVIKKTKKILGKVRKVMKINEESYEKTKKILGKVRKVVKIDEENLRKSEESYEDR